MADILCPMCGKPTPDDQETCRHCHAVIDNEALPAWLRELQASETSLPDQPSPAGESTPAEAELPDWLRQAAPPPETTPAAGAPVEPEAGEARPDWLKDLLPAAAKPGGPDEVIPDWLASPAEAEQPAELPASETEAPLEPAELPDWLARLQQQAPAEKPATSVPAFIFDEEGLPEEKPTAEEGMLSTLPDWVSQIAAEQPEETADEAETGLAPAELPGWLEAMRPLESVSPTGPMEDLSSAEMVAAGPLIGLRGVLSAEPDAIRARKPASLGLKLRVTEEQRARLTLLEELMAGEQKPKPLPSQPVITPQYLFRLAIAAVLLIPIIWVVITQANIASLPQGEDNPTALQFDTAVRKLNEGDPVLVAVDYEAGFVGEMELAAKVVLNRLVEQGAYPVLMSTNTAGPALGERVLNTFEVPEDVVYTGAPNLGYLPGGALGLAGLVQTPRQMLPFTLDGKEVWTLPPLDTVNTLADFGMVIVLANDADTTRAWIEQIGPALQESNVPLLLVVSAQAEPLVRPYAEGTSPLVSALLAGLPDSAAYENMATRYAVGRHEIWDAFSLVLPIAALVILIGGLTGGMITAIKLSQSDAKNNPPPRRKTEQTQERP